MALTPSPALPLKSKGKGERKHIVIVYTLPLSFKGRVREGLINPYRSSTDIL